MHEMSLCEGIVQVLEAQAREQCFSRVKAVWLEIGALAGVEIEALRFCFDVVCRDSLAEGAALHIDETPGQGWCMSCAKSVPVMRRYDPCPDCGGYQVQVTGGDQMRIRELEVE